MIIKCPGLQLDKIIKSSIFLMPYKQDLFWVGATYDRDFLDTLPSEQGREFLTSRLEGFLQLPFEVVDHKSGIRPTTIDRRPFLGSLMGEKRVMIFNGMGSRATLIAPWAANELFAYIYQNKKIIQDMDIARFNS